MNGVKTAILLGLLSGLLLFGGLMIGGRSGLEIALALSVVMNFASYFLSDKIALASYSAQPVTPQENPEGYKAYVAANAAPIRKYGGRFIVRGGQFEAKEGASRSRNVVLEFPSYQAALDCYNSPEYQETIALRAPHSTADIMVIEGYEGPQP